MDTITWLGHSTVLAELGGVRLVTDPLLRLRLAHLRRQVPAPAPPDRLDAVLVSHAHYDHLDLRTLGAIPGRPAIVVPAGAGRLVARLGNDVVELAPGESHDVGGVRVTAVPAVHDGRRTPLSSETVSLGYLIEGERRIYFPGDTERFAAMAELAPVDVALLPVWGWGTSLGPGHMDAAQAAEAVVLLRAAVAVPIHWGTYFPAVRRRRHVVLLRDPPHEFAAAVRRLAPDTRVEVLAIGGGLVSDPATGVFVPAGPGAPAPGPGD